MSFNACPRYSCCPFGCEYQLVPSACWTPAAQLISECQMLLSMTTTLCFDASCLYIATKGGLSNTAVAKCIRHIVLEDF